MKYAVFALAAVGTVPLAVALSLNLRWMKYAFWVMAVSMCLFQSTAINFFSHELYRGSSRGMEVSLVYLLALAMVVALAMRGSSGGAMSDVGPRLYVLYFLLCLPSLFVAEDLLVSWFEIWKMLMLLLFFAAVHSYLKATGDAGTIVRALALFVIVNTLFTVKAHYSGVYQPGGVFPHRNGMAMGMLLLGPIFFAGYLTHGLFSAKGLLCAVAFGGAVLSTMWSYSRGAMAMVPVAYGLAAFACFFEKRRSVRKLARMLPLVLIGLLGLALMLPRIVERFREAPESSGNTRVELAHCAAEMIRDRPWTGVGINNWSLNMEPTHPYQDRAGEILGYDIKYRGIVETVYLLVCAECGIPALAAMLLWFAWYWFLCIRLLKRLRGTEHYFAVAGIFGGLTANYLQSALEWVLRQQLNLICLMFLFALLSYLNTSRREPARKPDLRTP